jgi:lipoate-protein ligase A
MHNSATVNVPDGKLLEVTVSYDERLTDVRLTGDFFLEPPESRAELEAAVEDHPVDVSRERLVAAIEAVDARLIGFDAEHLAEATLEALE